MAEDCIFNWDMDWETWGNLFDKPWEEVVDAGSPFFPDGHMKIEVRISIRNGWREKE